jgi:CDP-glycerol glycerophosphotransferase
LQKWLEDENTANKRKNIVYEKYPEYMKEPINRKRIVFASMWGKKYSCNPQHLYEYIDKNYPDYECIWIFEDQYRPIRGNGKRVRIGSKEYYYYMATAKYFVNNVNFSDEYIKRKGQIELQTMHGTPLKTLGLDVVEDFPTEYYREKYLKKTARWNYLISQGEFVKNKAYSMFHFKKKVLKTGYPRTDFLFNVTPEEIKKIKKKLGLPLNKKIILYTPTWRKKNRFDMEMDIQKMKEALSDEYILLIRIHHLCGTNYDFEVDNKFSFDLTSYNTIEDLYLIADLLITDYSSVMFDYALLNRPMIFYTYDFDDYSENLRGLYVDFQKEAPGPIVYDTDTIIENIKNIDKHYETYKDRIEAFISKYLTYENGESCKKVVKAFLKPKFSLKRHRILEKRREKEEKNK